MQAATHRTSNIVWLVIYLATVTAIVLAMVHLRTTVVAQMSDQVEIDKWLAWKAEAGTKDNMQGTVFRRVPTSAEPPMLVLIRDYFPAVLTAVLTFYSLVFAFAWFIARGLAKAPTKADTNTAETLRHRGK